MRPLRTAQTNVTFGGPGFEGLPAQRCHACITDARAGQEPGVIAAIRSVWAPDDEERQRVAGGANIELIVIGSGMPACLLKTTTDPFSAVWEDGDEEIQ